MAVLWLHCLTAPSIDRGQPSGMCDLSSASPLFSITDRNIGTSIVALKLTFFCSNALIALARSLCKCLLAVLITASEADAVTGFLVRGASQYDTIPRREKKKHSNQTNTSKQQNHKKQKTTQKSTNKKNTRTKTCGFEVDDFSFAVPGVHCQELFFGKSFDGWKLGELLLR